MAGIDQILSIVVQQAADELRLGSDQEPQVFAAGARRRFTMSATSEAVLRQLLGEILSPERETELARTPRLQFEYDAASIGCFQVQLTRRATGGIEVVFRKAGQGKPQREEVASPSPRRDAAADAAQLSPRSRSPLAPESPPRGGTDGGQIDPSLLPLVERAMLSRASDIHLADGQPTFMRVDGRLRAFPDVREAPIAELFCLDGAAIERIRSGQALEFGLTLSPRERLRTCVYRTDSGLAAAIRLLPTTAPGMDELNLPIPLQNYAELPHGLVLVCGATGSGKSTTLAALCRHALERRSILLVTLEDPIEYTLSGTEQSLVRQRQLGRDVPDFATGLRDSLRGDPDIIMVGELRDAETIRLAITAAETGHLVLASLHGGSASACIERLVDAYPAEQRAQIRVQLADALRGIIVQRLVPRAKTSGRVPALEVLRVNHGVGNVIREGKTAQIASMLQSGKREGMISLERCLAEYVQAGVIEVDRAKEHANDADSLSMYLGK